MKMKNLRVYAINGVKIAVSVGLLALLFSRIDLDRLWEIARHASMPWLLAALGTYAVAVLVCTWRWHRLLDIQNVQVPRRTVLASFLVSLFFNNFLPTNIGGDIIRVGDTARPAKSSTLATTIVVADRVVGLIGLVLFVALALSLAAATGKNSLLPISPWWIWGTLAAATAVSVLVLLVPGGIQRILRPFPFLQRGWLGNQIETLSHSLLRFRACPGGLMECFVAAIIVQAVNAAFYVCVAHALQVNVSAGDLAVIVPFSSLVQVIPLSINGFGVREAAFSVFFARIGLPIESAVVVSLVATGLIMLSSLVGAAVYIARQRQPATESEPTYLGNATLEPRNLSS
jgi:uncharacterized membrane protein YbhN (UPF0104 family)